MLKISLVLLSITLITDGQECLALALAGGGGRGAYEVGVLSALVNSTKSVNVKYNSISGISIGAVNVGLMSQFPVGQEIAMVDYLLTAWRTIKGNSDVYVEWKGGIVDGLLFQKGLFSDAPVIALAKKFITKDPSRNVTVGSTNLDTGIFQNFNESVGLAIIDAITCSASIPTSFPPHNFEGYTWVDGGVVMTLDVFSAVQRCLDVTGNEKDIVIDMIYCDPYSPLPSETSFKTLDVFERSYNIQSYDKSVWYTYNTAIAYPDVEYRFVIQPSEPIAPSLNFTAASIEFDIALGIKDGENAINAQLSGKSQIEAFYQAIKSKIIYP